jgi:bifunctional non-homologous end joining protein LigD
MSAENEVGCGRVGAGKAFFEEVSSQGLEGIVAKRLESRYWPGKRWEAWIKIKPKRRSICRR